MYCASLKHTFVSFEQLHAVQYPSIIPGTPDTPGTPTTGKGLWRVATSVPLPLPSHTPRQYPRGFENPCPSLLVEDLPWCLSLVPIICHDLVKLTIPFPFRYTFG